MKKNNTGIKLWKKAKNIIPGGNMLLSKRPEMFLPDFWPAYFSKSKGCSVWDLDNKKYYDMSLMGVGTNILGYGCEEVDEEVRNVIEKGNMSSLNCPEEVYLAEKLIKMHPWAEMVRFARTGGEANSIAVRIARAASGRDKVAVCGYHGWHDWYLAANLNDDSNLDGHLLPGLEPAGVPRNLKDSIVTFKYNNLEELEKIVNEHNPGVIKMEVSRNETPDIEYLRNVRNLCNKNNIILIFDECTSGFRETFGGLHKKYEINPDMAIFGKALGNGYAITSIIGKKDIMDFAQKTFISSTFWTERIGPAAALKTLEIMEMLKSWDIITKKGNIIRQKWLEIANKNSLSITVQGLPALSSFKLNYKNMNAYKTLISQYMLANGFLASNVIYTSICHEEHIIDEYFYHLSKVFKIIKECEEGLDVKSLLDGDICHSGFKRLN